MLRVRLLLRLARLSSRDTHEEVEPQDIWHYPICQDLTTPVVKQLSLACSSFNECSLYEGYDALLARVQSSLVVSASERDSPLSVSRAFALPAVDRLA